MSPEQRQLVARLIHDYAGDSGTESMISRVAETMGLLTACQALFDAHGAVAPSLSDWLRTQCAEHGVDEGQFRQAVRQVLAMFNAIRSERGDYEVLGLAPGASLAEIKSAYRALSLRYHPDRAFQGEPYDPDRFIEINRAYHTLTQTDTTGRSPRRGYDNFAWNRTRKKRLRFYAGKKLYIWTAGAAVLVILIVAFSSISVRRQAMLAGLNEDRGAFIPPDRVMHAEGGTARIVAAEAVADKKTAFLPEKIGTSRPPGFVQYNGDGKTAEQLQQPAVVNRVDKKREPTHPELESPEEKTVASRPAFEDAEVQDSGPQSAEHTKRPPLGTRAAQATTYNPPDSNAIRQDPDAMPAQQAGPAQVEKRRGEPEQTEAANLPPAPVIDDEPVPVAAAVPVVPSADIAVTAVPQQKAVAALDAHVGTMASGTVVGISPKPESQTETVEADALEQRLEAFFRSYTNAYEARDIDRFVQFFTTDAIENDQKLTERIPVYEEMFSTTKDISLAINIVQWRRRGDGVMAEGRFSVHLTYKNGKNMSGNGFISFALKEAHQDLLAHAIHYRFDD
jgi:curved DNA-binding protein CbpA/ketosteroid isomerase-like protein